VENFYNRVDNIDDLIGSVKLPYLAWKVLFLVDKKTDSDKIAGLLETKESEVKSSLDLLVQNGLVSAEETAQPEKEEKVQAVEPEPEPEQQPEVQEESSKEEESEEVSASDVIEESIVEEEEIEDEIVEEVDEEEPEEAQESAEEEQAQEETEEADEDTVETALDEGEEEIELLQETEDDTIQEQVTDSEEEEKIEINIPEGEEEEETDESEFNFNLTGEEAAQAGTVKEEAPPAEPEKEMDTSGFKKILVIDDSLVIRKMVEIALEEEEFNIHTAVSGKEGLDIMDKTNPDLVILDMMLPDINGIEILKTIKASKGIPVIMLSGKDSPQMIETAKNEGAEEFLPKPFKDDDLVEKIKKLI